MNELEQVFGSSFNPGYKIAEKPNDELGQEDFFKLMVAQLENQDPTKPLDNTEFLGQLAQFSTVSGIDDMNESFVGLVNNLFTSQAMMAAQLIDREVLTESGFTLSANYKQGEAYSGGFVTDVLTANTRVNIYDATGNQVNAISMGNVDAGSHQFTWNGTTFDGSSAESGSYLMVAEGYVNGIPTSLPMQQFSRIASVSVDRQNTSVLLHLDNGENVTFSQVNEFK